MTTLLRTGEAAALLGVSRQHVVNLCERGDLAFTMVGSHRRIPRDEVDRVIGGRSHSREREKSLWLHRAVLGELVRDPESVIGIARANIDHWLDLHSDTGLTRVYLQTWSEILDAGVDAVVDALTSTSEVAFELRQNSPFAGVLHDADRTMVLRSFVRHWRAEHAA